MLGAVFAILILLSILSAAATGNLAALSDAALDGAARAVTLTLSLGGMMCLFGGVMRLLSAAGLLTRLTRLLRPLLAYVFPQAAKTGEGLDEISANLAANLLGVGNAATPFAIAAMEKLQKHNPAPDTATDDMVTLAVLNSSSVNLLPTTLIALRRAGGSLHAAAVLLPVWLVSAVCAVAAVLLSRLLCRVFPINHTTKRKDGQVKNAGISIKPCPAAPARRGGDSAPAPREKDPHSV